jgi:predicted amidohydrolase
MSSMLALGLKLEQAVPMVTSHPAELLGLSDIIGALRPGMHADVTVINHVCKHHIRPVTMGVNADADCAAYSQ